MDLTSQALLTPSEKRRVLIIDDELGPRESMRFQLRKKYEVLSEELIEKGIKALEKFKPDVIVMNIRMPGVDGIEGLRRIREIDAVISVILLTGYSSMEAVRSAIRLGANDYLKKPVDTPEMMRVIADNIRRTDVTRRKIETETRLHKLTESLMVELEEKHSLSGPEHSLTEHTHDFSSPLTVVIKSVDLLSRELKNVDASLQSSDRSELAMEYIMVIEEGLARCQDLISLWRNLEKNDVLER